MVSREDLCCLDSRGVLPALSSESEQLCAHWIEQLTRSVPRSQEVSPKQVMRQGPDNGVELTPLAGETRKQLAQEEEKYSSPRLPLNDDVSEASTTPQYQTPPAATDRWDRTVLRCEVKANQVIRVLAIGCILIFGYVTQGAAKRMWHQRTARFSVSLPPMKQLLDTRGRKVVGSLDPLMQFGV
ncbi:hypothetical protein THAOC_19307, partial [Thalassiosira oceanica]